MELHDVALLEITVEGLNRDELLGNFRFELDVFMGLGSTIPVTLIQNGPVTKHETRGQKFYRATRTYRIGEVPETAQSSTD